MDVISNLLLKLKIDHTPEEKWSRLTIIVYNKKVDMEFWEDIGFLPYSFFTSTCQWLVLNVKCTSYLGREVNWSGSEMLMSLINHECNIIFGKLFPPERDLALLFQEKDFGFDWDLNHRSLVCESVLTIAPSKNQDTLNIRDFFENI